MLPKKARVPKGLFPRRAEGRLLNGDFFSLKIAPSPRKDNLFSFVVSAKVARTAVGRNRLRRRGYAAVAAFSGRFKPSHLFVFFAKAAAASASFNDLSRDIGRLTEGFRR